MFIAALAMAAASPVFAQTEQKADTTETVEYSTDKYKVETNSFWSNWFISAGAGAQFYVGEWDSKLSFGKRLSPSVDVNIGKWFTPGIGVRFGYNGVSAKGATPKVGLSTGEEIGGANSGVYKSKLHYYSFRGDAMFNLSNILCGYNEKRLYSFIPYAGFGVMKATTGSKQTEFAGHLGLLNTFRLCPALDLNLDLRGTLVEDDFDGEELSEEDLEDAYEFDSIDEDDYESDGEELDEDELNEYESSEYDIDTDYEDDFDEEELEPEELEDTDENDDLDEDDIDGEELDEDELEDSSEDIDDNSEDEDDLDGEEIDEDDLLDDITDDDIESEFNSLLTDEIMDGDEIDSETMKENGWEVSPRTIYKNVDTVQETFNTLEKMYDTTNNMFNSLMGFDKLKNNKKSGNKAQDKVKVTDNAEENKQKVEDKEQ